MAFGPGVGSLRHPARNAADVWIKPGGRNREGRGSSRCSPTGPADKVVAEFRRLVLDEKANFVTGYVSAANCLAVPPVAED